MKIEDVKDALMALQGGISSSDSQSIAKSLATLDGALAERVDGMDAQLKHYLTRRSYGKALDYIRGEPGIAPGNCSKKPNAS